MSHQFLSPDAFKNFVSRVLATRRAIARVNLDGIVLWGAVRSFEDCDFDTLLPRDTLKKYQFLPADQVLAYTKEARMVEVRGAAVEADETVVLGSRPCDAFAVRSLDGVFTTEPAFDPYRVRREKTTIVSMSCHQPAETCFCTSAGIGPDSTEGSDLLLTEVSGGFFVEVVTEKGRELVATCREYFTEAGEEGTGERNRAGALLREKVTREAQYEAVRRVLDRPETFSHEEWEKIGQTCIGCGVCTFLCPTCHCFDIVDEPVLDRGSRWKIWDACQFADFTLEASGHNPRDRQYKRYRNRVFCKFKYYIDFYQMTGCVGCGRCIRYCPVGIDITEAATRAAGGRG